MNSQILYVNGLGNGEWQQRQHWMIKDWEGRGYQVEHTHLNWLANEDFEDHLDTVVLKAEDLLQSKGHLAIVGSSAGGSMAVNAFGKLASENVIAINMCGRLGEGRLRTWDWRKLSTMAHIGTKRASQSFYDSVKFCETKTIPNLTEQQKERLFVLHQLFDFVVPHSTMLIPDVDNHRLPVMGHGLGILMAGRIVPSIIQKKQNSTD